MKKSHIAALALGALGIAAATLPAVSKTMGEKTLKSEEQLNAAALATTNITEQGPARAAGTGGILYWQTARSIYAANGQRDPENGQVHEFGSRVVIDGEKATIYGLCDFYFMEVDKEYPVEGTFDKRASTITITGTEYIPGQSLDKYIKVADVYDEAANKDYTLVLIAGEESSSGVETQNTLTLKVAEDMSTITSQVSYGFYAFTKEGEGVSFYDYYKTTDWKKAEANVNWATNTADINFSGLFIAPGMPGKQTISLFNKGSETGQYKITTSTPELTVTPAEGTLQGCSSRSLNIEFNPESVGQFEGNITISGSGSTLTLPINIAVNEKPEYTKIVKAGSQPISFEMSPLYPFVIGRYDGHTAAISTNNGKGDNTESWFSCIVNVPDGKTGVFSWDAIMEAQQPNGLHILLDGDVVKSEWHQPNTLPFDLSGVLCIPEGRHTITFDNKISADWTKYDTDSYSYVWGLDFRLYDKKDDSAILVSDNVDFGETFYDTMSVEVNSEIAVLNLGSNTLKVTGISGDRNFSGSVPTMTAANGGEIIVPLTWTVSKVGDDKGSVTIHTTAGDLTVNCSGKANELPYDYHKIVTEGDFSFNTGSDWPFYLNENVPYLYNSTSKADINGITYSWLEAQFEVPEGKVGRLSWDAINDSEKLYVFMGIGSVISGTFFTIDGEQEVMIGGLNVNCASANLYEPQQLMFRPGRHTVKFNYKKSFDDEDKVFGDDRIKLFEIGLKLLNADDNKGNISIDSAEFKQDVFVGTSGHIPATIYNFTTLNPEILSCECDGPFTAKEMSVEKGNLNLMIEFNPEKEGSYENELTVKTNIGDYKVSCSGTATKSDLGKAIFYESFEYGFMNDWILVDKSGQDPEQKWAPFGEWGTSFKNNDAYPWEGNGTLMIGAYNQETHTYWNNSEQDTYATTPAINIPVDGKTTLRFMFKSATYQSQSMNVLVGEGDDPADYTVVETITDEYNIAPNVNGKMAWTAYTVDLTKYAGKTIHVSFHAGPSLTFFFAIDDVLVASTGSVGVNQVTDSNAVSTEYYSAQGVRLARPAKGLNIVVTRKADSTSETRKVMVR